LVSVGIILYQSLSVFWAIIPSKGDIVVKAIDSSRVPELSTQGHLQKEKDKVSGQADGDITSFNDLILKKIQTQKQYLNPNSNVHSNVNASANSHLNSNSNSNSPQNTDPNSLHISGHAAKRIEQRQIQWDGEEYLKLQEALTKLKNKGSKESLVITKSGAYILDVTKSTVVTAIDKKHIIDNIFTKIDSTIVMD
jgi:flagellar operon protein